MATYRERYGLLVVDFRYLNKRCREKTNLTDTPANRKKLGKMLEKLEAEILLGTFDYAAYFPKSSKLKEMQALANRVNCCASGVPSFGEFAQEWFLLNEVGWRESYKKKIRIILDKYLLPHFDGPPVDAITRTDVLSFRKSLTKVHYGNAQNTLSASRINQIMIPLRMILDEAAHRYGFDTPFVKIKNLPEEKSEVNPFSFKEIWLFLNGVRKDYKPYYTVRFFTGMRTSEANGLMWSEVDFDKRLIFVKQALVDGKLVPPKTKESKRFIKMNDAVYEALQLQYSSKHPNSTYVFCNTQGNPLCHRNVSRRVWHPTLKLLGIPQRKGNQTRHTAASLWLASGEAPEWVAKQLGHSNIQMLFRNYSHYIPNATRQDGSAFETLLNLSKPDNDSEASECKANQGGV